MARMQQHPAVEHVGAAIRERRKAAGWTQEAFAGSIDLDRSYYSHIERGGINISLLVLFRIAAGLRCQPGDLMPQLTALRKLPKPSRSRGRRSHA